MSLERLPDILTGILQTYLKQAPIIAFMIVLFTLWSAFDSQAASPGKRWWRNQDLSVDVAFGLLNSLLGPYLMTPVLLVIILLFSGVMTAQETMEYISMGHGPLSVFSFWWQLGLYLLISDFLAYWTHRVFHTARMWKFHATHHSAEQIDWTTAYRFHPIDLALEHVAITVVMMALGISAEVIVFLAPATTLVSTWLHSNSNWNLGPFKYVFVTPVMHRWHHSLPNEGGNSNFGQYFAFWDFLFGTFYMPEGRLPQVFGVDDPTFPKDGFIEQLVYPVRLPPGKSAPASAGENGRAL